MIKKGFTLVELIISITLILIIGTVALFANIKKNTNSIEKTNNTVLTASLAYANAESDSDGNSYVNSLLTYAKGVKIPLSSLVAEGYIKENTKNEIYEKYDEITGRTGNQDYYVLLTNNGEGNTEGTDYCQDGATINAYGSWFIESDTPIYLCNTKQTSGGSTSTNLIDKIIDDNGGNIPEITTTSESDLFEDTGDLTYYTNATITSEFNGKYLLDTGSFVNDYSPILKLKYNKFNGLYRKNSQYYFRGNINNNYLSITDSAIPETVGFRIINFNKESGTIKLVPDIRDYFGGYTDFFTSSNININEVEQAGCTVKNSLKYGAKLNSSLEERFESGASDSREEMITVTCEEYIGWNGTSDFYVPPTYHDLKAFVSLNVYSEYVYYEKNDCYLTQLDTIQGKSYSLIKAYDTTNGTTYYQGIGKTNKGIFYKSELIENTTLKNQLEENIIKVYEINLSKFKFNGEGTGTDQNPYKISFERNI